MKRDLRIKKLDLIVCLICNKIPPHTPRKMDEVNIVTKREKEDQRKIIKKNEQS
jgi:hypothetical protein